MCKKNGFSLVEVLVSLVIISLALVAWTSNFTVGVRGPERAEDKTTSVFLAQAILEEIRSASFADPNQSPVFGLESGEAATPPTRINFDDVDDYNNWNESPPQRKDGSTLSGLSRYRRSVTVANVTQNNFNTSASPGTTDFKKVTVSVYKVIQNNKSNVSVIKFFMYLKRNVFDCSFC